MESFENIHALFKQIKLLESELAGLRSRMSQFETFEKENRLLRKENATLKDKLAKYENPKNSNNSSIHPSKDENRPFKSKSLRKKTGRKPGGQKGHEGTTLEMSSNPNKIIDHEPEYCECCGKDIGAMPGEFVERKQVIDLPPIEPVVTEHSVYKKECSCGHVTKSSFPKGFENAVLVHDCWRSHFQTDVQTHQLCTAHLL
jgi:transposase